jgi:hypothetical protein
MMTFDTHSQILRLSGKMAVLLLTKSVWAQTPAPVPAAQEDDLEIPSAATPTPAATGQPAPTTTTAAPTVTAPQAADKAVDAKLVELERKLTEINLRLEELQRQKQRTEQVPQESKVSAASPEQSKTVVNLERSAHSRPIPEGLKIGGYVQAQLEINQLSENQLQQGGEPLNLDRFSVRRARLRLDRGWDFASATLEIDANTHRGPAVGPRRAEASVFYRGKNPDNLPPLVMLSAGLTDIPFGYELLESARTRTFMERSVTSGALFPTEMDLGVKLSGAVDFVRYGVALMNGEPVTAQGFPRDPNAAKDFVGRVGVETKPIESLTVSGGTSFAVGKGFHAGQNASKATVTWRDDNEDNVVQPGEIVGAPGSAATPSENFERWVLGLDLQLALKTSLGLSKLYGELYVANNYDRGYLVADPVAVGADLRHAGGYVALLQDITRYAIAGFRAAFYDPNSDVLEERRGDIVPLVQTTTTLSPVAGVVLPERAKLLLQYDFVIDHLGRDAQGVPKDAKNNQLTARLQVDL